MRISAVMIAGAVLAGVAGPAAAQDCERLSGVAQIVCADDALAALNARLHTRVESALDVARAQDDDASAAVEAVRAEQASWENDLAECAGVSEPRACLEAAYLPREAELVASWLLEEPDAQAAYYCGDIYADELIALFFDTEMPAARLEYGGTVDIAIIAPSGSGSRYEGTFGRSIWLKGDAATLVWTDGDELACEAVE